MNYSNYLLSKLTGNGEKVELYPVKHYSNICTLNVMLWWVNWMFVWLFPSCAGISYVCGSFGPGTASLCSVASFTSSTPFALSRTNSSNTKSRSSVPLHTCTKQLIKTTPKHTPVLSSYFSLSFLQFHTSHVSNVMRLWLIAWWTELVLLNWGSGTDEEQASLLLLLSFPFSRDPALFGCRETIWLMIGLGLP